MRRMENDLLFFHELIGNCSVEKDSKTYTISPKFGKGTMQSFEVMPGAEIVYSNVHITTPIQKNIQCKDRFIEVTYCFHGQMNMLFSDQPDMIMSDHYISVFNGASHLKSCDFGKEPFIGVSVVAYLPQIINSLNIMLGTVAFDEDMDFHGLFTAGGCFVAPATKSVEHIFTELLLLPEQYRNYLMRIIRICGQPSSNPTSGRWEVWTHDFYDTEILRPCWKTQKTALSCMAFSGVDLYLRGCNLLYFVPCIEGYSERFLYERKFAAISSISTKEFWKCLVA